MPAQLRRVSPCFSTLAGFCLVAIGLCLCRYAYTPLVPYLITAGWVDEAGAGYLGGFNCLGYFAGCLVALFLPAYVSLRTILRLSILGAALSIAMCAWNLGFAWLALGRLLTGLAGASLVIHTPSLALVHVPVAWRKIAGGIIFAGAGSTIVLISLTTPFFLGHSIMAGWLLEATFAVNHLGYFLLTNLLAERIASTAGARIVSIASDAHKLSREIDFDDLQCERRYKWMDVYGRSKGANLLFTRELARRLEPAGVVVHAIHPGFVRSSMGANNGLLGRTLVPIIGLFAMSAARAARHVVAVCTEEEYARRTGGYFYKGKPNEVKPWAASDASASRLWTASEQLTGLQRPS